jgi:glycosyltransferase involved in cell wall biosynthesis
MMRVAALTSGRNVPSARFRVRQHIELLRGMGIDVTESTPAVGAYTSIPWSPSTAVGTSVLRGLYFGLTTSKMASRLPGLVASRRADITWLERGLLPGRPTLERWLGTPLVLDVDDAIWLSSPAGERAARSVASRAAVVIAGNRFLADWFSAWCDDVRVIPTAIDTARFSVADPPLENERFTIVWTGLSGSFPYLHGIEGALHRFLERWPAELRIVAERQPAFRSIDPGRVQFIPWSPQTEASSLASAQVGIMPLGLSDWERGKCSFKMLQYMASGLPVVVTPVGMNAEVLAMGEVGFGAVSEDDWVDALESIASDPERGRVLGRNGRDLVDERFSREVISDRIREVFESLA